MSLSTASAIDRAFVSEAARLSLMQAFIGTVTANQSLNPQVRAFGAQVAANQFALYNQLNPLLTDAGLNVSLTAVDRAVILALPTLGGSDLDSQAMLFSSFYALQAAGLAQFASILGTDATLRAFGASQVSSLQSQLQTGAGLLGTGGTTALNMFGQMGGFGAFTSTGLGTAGFNANGAFNSSAFNSNLGAGGFGTSGFGTSGFSTFGSAPTGGFGPGASFGSNTGFGPSNGTTGFSNNSGFGPANGTTGFSNSGFGPANGTGSSFNNSVPIF